MQNSLQNKMKVTSLKLLYMSHMKKNLNKKVDTIVKNNNDADIKLRSG